MNNNLFREIINSKIFKAFMVNLIVLVCVVLVFSPRYENEADIVMQSILYGVAENGIQSSHILFSNFIFGYLLKLMYIMLPQIGWYTIIHYGLAFFSLTTITFVFMSKQRSIINKFVFYIILFFGGYECFVLPGYMKTSCILVIGGCFLFKSYKKDIISNIVSISMIVLGSLISTKIALFTLCLCIVMSLYKKKPEIKSVVFFLTCVVLMLLFWIVDRYNYNTSEVLNMEGEYRDSFEKIYSYGVPEFKDEYLDINGIDSENTYNMLGKGFFINGNTTIYTTIKNIASIKRKVCLDSFFIVVRNILSSFFHNILFYVVILLLLILIVFDNKKEYAVYCLCVLIVISVLLGFMEMCNKPWIFTIISMPFIIQMVDVINLQTIDNNKIFIVYILSFSILIYTKLILPINYVINYDNSYASFEQLDMNTTYVLDYNGYMQQFSIFAKYPENLKNKKNVVAINGIYSMISGFGEINSLEHYSAQDQWIYNPGIYSVLFVPKY